MTTSSSYSIIDDGTDLADLADPGELAWVHPAKSEDVAHLLSLPANVDFNTRSDWVWIRFRDGTLALAVFPQGDTYMEFSDADVAPYGKATLSVIKGE